MNSSTPRDSTPRILVAGIGNIFLGDDAFGVEVVRRLIESPIPQGVRVVDFGIRGLDLTYCLLDKFEMVILIDAVPRDEPPGTLFVIEPDLSALQNAGDSEAMIDAHGMHPEKVLRAAASMGAEFGKVLLVGCQPMPFDAEHDMQMDLSDPVRAAVGEAANIVQSLISKFLQDERSPVGVGASSPEHHSDAAKDSGYVSP
ncbi:MAG TPA: hydrogenase maturation protease [Tepidisphaeraceae bacterium]|jgi:hydrogenase maturation protease